MKKRNANVDFLLFLLVISKLSNDNICPLKNDNITHTTSYQLYKTEVNVLCACDCMFVFSLF